MGWTIRSDCLLIHHALAMICSLLGSNSSMQSQWTSLVWVSSVFMGTECLGSAEDSVWQAGVKKKKKKRIECLWKFYVLGSIIHLLEHWCLSTSRAETFSAANQAELISEGDTKYQPSLWPHDSQATFLYLGCMLYKGNDSLYGWKWLSSNASVCEAHCAGCADRC